MRRPRKIAHITDGQHRKSQRRFTVIAKILMLLCLFPHTVTAENTSPTASDHSTADLNSTNLSTTNPSTSAPSTTALTVMDIEAAISLYMNEFLEKYPRQEGQKIDYSIEQLDLRVHLNPCKTALDIKPYQRQPNTLASKITLQLECDVPKRWRLFVPVKIHITDRVVVAQTATPRNSALTSDQLDYQYLDVSNLRKDYFRDMDDVSGYITRQFLRQGTIISQHHVTPPRVIQKNQEVVILASGKHLSVKSKGIALSDGKVGDRIRVKNKSSHRVLEGRVTSAGFIQITY